MFEGLISHSLIGTKKVIRNTVKKYITLRSILLMRKSIAINKTT